MNRNQNETSELRVASRGLRGVPWDRPFAEWRLGSHLETRNSKLAARAFTLTELLVVITIIAILAGLITGAAINALNRAKQAAITLEIQQLAGSLEDIKNTYGAYPPNVFRNSDTTLGLTNNEKRTNASNLVLFMRKSVSRSTEFQTVLQSPPQRNTTSDLLDNLYPVYETGLTPAEALVFWLQGFSKDVQRPLSGTDLVARSIDDNGTTEDDVITIESFTPLYDFDRGRLRISRDSNGKRRSIKEIYRADGSGPFEILLYEYLPSGSQQPFVYFDTSRETPQQVVNNWENREFFYASPTIAGSNIFPLKKIREDAPKRADWVSPHMQYIDYVEKGKFQILHCGIDDLWGNFRHASDDGQGGELDVTQSNPNSADIVPKLLFPTGPFLNDVADTVGNFMTGTLADEQE